MFDVLALKYFSHIFIRIMLVFKEFTFHYSRIMLLVFLTNIYVDLFFRKKKNSH
jgi:hypothetical protein